MDSPPPDPYTGRRMRVHHAHTAMALDVQVEPGTEFWGWGGCTLDVPARTYTSMYDTVWEGCVIRAHQQGG